jgi:phage terminase large subunit-like protein
MYGVMKSSMGSRDEPLLIVITTAGFDTESFCYSLRTYGVEILSGAKVDESQFVLIYTIDDEDDFANPGTWEKANPNLGVSVKKGYLAQEVNKASQNAAEKSGVLVKHFNKWLRSNTLDIWIDEEYVLRSMTDVKITDPMFAGKECIVGVDLSSVSDITAVSYLFQVDNLLYFFVDYYLPEDSLNTNINVVGFKMAGAAGEMTLTPGNVCDYKYILRDIQAVGAHAVISLINYDKYNSTQFIIDATEAGLPCRPFSQMPGSLNKPLKEFERLIKSGGIRLERNQLTKWMFSNVLLITNKMGNVSIDKASRSKKIDGIAAMCNSLGGLLENPIYDFTVQ